MDKWFRELETGRISEYQDHCGVLTEASLSAAELEQIAQPQRQLNVGAGRGLGQSLVYALVGVLPHGGHEPGQHAHPGQQHPLSAQPRHGLLEQRDGALGVDPGPGTHELHQPLAHTPAAKSRYPYPAQIPHACSYAVCCRSVYRLTTDGSAMSSSPATYSTADHGTSRGSSVRKCPR
jgi:hypothetical protein